ncbi:MAG: DUF3823 domain-containing protein, partial [Sphingobacteriaceae bacterium]
MKIKYLLYITLITLFASCKKDNYDAPNISLNGRVVYKGVPINVEQTYENTSIIELWQPGFGKIAPINTAIAQDGSYSQMLFKGNYKLTMRDGNGPWMWRRNTAGRPDTVFVNLQGDQSLDLEVTPYYMIRNSKFAINSRNINANFDLEKVITDAANGKNIESVTLYINKTQFVSASSSIANASLNTVTNFSNISLNVAIPALIPTQNYVFARIAVKIAGVGRLL